MVAVAVGEVVVCHSAWSLSDHDLIHQESKLTQGFLWGRGGIDPSGSTMGASTPSACNRATANQCSGTAALALPAGPTHMKLTHTHTHTLSLTHTSIHIIHTHRQLRVSSRSMCGCGTWVCLEVMQHSWLWVQPVTSKPPQKTLLRGCRHCKCKTEVV